jgi:hypothetical protein
MNGTVWLDGGIERERAAMKKNTEDQSQGTAKSVKTRIARLMKGMLLGVAELILRDSKNEGRCSHPSFTDLNEEDANIQEFSKT